MSNPTKTRPTTPINNLFISAASLKNPNYQEIITQFTRAPNLSQILKKTNTPLSTLEFITFEQYLHQNNLASLCNDYFDRNDHFQRYETQLQRRVRQLEILLEMQNKHFQKRHKNTSAQKSSRNKIQTPKHKKYQDFSKHIQRELQKDKKAAKHTSQSHQYEYNNLNSRKSSRSHRKMSLVSSRYSRQNSINRIQTYKRMKQVQIFQAYTEGKPYIEQYYNQLKNRMQKIDNQKLKTMPSSSREKMSRKVSKAGKIKKQMVQNKSYENQYANQFTQNNYQKTKTDQNVNRKSVKRQYQDNEYAMIPMKNEKIKERLSRKKRKNSQKETCRQLVTEVKKYEEMNQRYINKLKSIDKEDKYSREKLFEASSRDKFEKKRNIQRLKNRISSKSSRKDLRY